MRSILPAPTLLASLLISLLPLHGQEASSDAADAPPVLHVTTQFVVLDTQVQNKKTGKLIGSLGPRDFQLDEDRRPQSIAYFSQDSLPLSVVFLLDLTDTVRPVLKQLADGAREVLGHLKPQDEVAVMMFSSQTELLQDFTTDRGLAAAAITKASGMKSKDGTFIHEDMHEAAGQAMKSTLQNGRRVMVWLTDGTANYENSFTKAVIGKDAPARLHTEKEATTELLRSGAVVSALVETSDDTDAAVEAARVMPFSFLGAVRLDDIANYARATGGFTLGASNRNVAARLALLIDELRERYTLGYKPNTPKPPGTYCKLDVRLSPAARGQHPELKKTDLVVYAKRGYYR